jgi:hypothetical protein
MKFYCSFEIGEEPEKIKKTLLFSPTEVMANPDRKQKFPDTLLL